MVGSDSLEISATQRVLLPIITATVVAESGESSQTLHELAMADIKNAPYPPAQELVKINNTRKFSEPLDEYLFETTVFQLNIPSSPYAQSLADYLVPPIKTRNTNLPCVTARVLLLWRHLTKGGSNILLRFLAPETKPDCIGHHYYIIS